MSDHEGVVESSTPLPSQVYIPIPVNLPLPSQLSMTGNLSTNWKRFKRSWDNYEIAVRLKDPSHSGANKELRTATLLTCIGADALDVYDGFVFESPEQMKDIDVIIQKFEKYCIGETNETYERYRFNKRDQNQSESVDAYATALRTLAKTCNFGQLEDDLIRDRIVTEVRDESTRKKLLQVAKLTLAQCVDICRSYEKTSKQLESMKSEEVMGFDKQVSKQSENQKRKEEENVIRCKFCAKMHVRDKFQCPAWGKSCTLCKKKNHFAAICTSKVKQDSRKRLSGSRGMVSSVDRDTDSSEEYIAMLTMKEDVSEVYFEEYVPKPYASMMINS